MIPNAMDADDLAFFRDLHRTSEEGVLAALLKLVRSGSLEDLLLAGRVLCDIVPSADFLANRTHRITVHDPTGGPVEFVFCSYAVIAAQTMCSPTVSLRHQAFHERFHAINGGVADIEFALPAFDVIDEAQQALLKRIVHTHVQPGDEGTKVLASMLSAYTEVGDDPWVVRLLLDVGTGEGSCESHENGAAFYEVLIAALDHGRWHTFVELMKPQGESLENARQQLLQIAGCWGAMRTNPAVCIADMMVVQGRNYAGLHCVQAILQGPDCTELQSLQLRAQVLHRYLLSSAQMGVEWDPVQIGWFMGDEVADERLPAMRHALHLAALVERSQAPGLTSPDQLVDPENRLPADIVDDVVAMALRTHCLPVLHCLKPRLLLLCEKNLFHVTGINHEQRISPVGAMLYPVNPAHAPHPTHFNRCLELVIGLGLHGRDLEDRSLDLAAPLALAREMEKGRDWVLQRLLEAGFDPDVRDPSGRHALSWLNAADQSSWQAIVRSFRAQAAARDALDNVRQTHIP